MAITVSQLQAAIGADDSQFQAAVGRVRQGARQVVNDVNQMGGAAKTIGSAFLGMGGTAVSALGTIREGLEKARSGLESLSSQAERAGRELSIALTVPIAGAIKLGLEFDEAKKKATIAFTTMFGGAKQAKSMIDQLTRFSWSTQLQPDFLYQQAQMLKGFGVAAQNVIPSIKGIDDALTLMGRGSPATIERITQDVGEMLSMGKMTAMQFRSLGSVGINAAQILSQEFGIPEKKIREMVTKGVIPAQQAFQALIHGMEKMAPDAMSRGMDTLTASFSNLKAVAQVTLGSLFQPLYDDATKVLKQVSDRLQGLTETFTHMSDDLKRKFAAGLFSVASIGPTLLAVSGLAKAFALLLSPIGLVAGAIAGLSYYFLTHKEAAQEVADFFKSHYTQIMGDVKRVMDAVVHSGEVLGPALISALPSLLKLLDGFSSLIDKFSHLSPSVQGAILAFMAFNSPILKLGGLVGTFVKSLDLLGPATATAATEVGDGFLAMAGTASTEVGAIGTSILALAGPGGWILGIGIALGTAVVAWENDWGHMREVAQSAVDAIGKNLFSLHEQLLQSAKDDESLLGGAFKRGFAWLLGPTGTEITDANRGYDQAALDKARQNRTVMPPGYSTFGAVGSTPSAKEVADAWASYDRMNNTAFDPHSKSLESNLYPRFAGRLNQLRTLMGQAGYPFKIGEGYRTPEEQHKDYLRHASTLDWNQGLHTHGLAADVVPETRRPGFISALAMLSHKVGLQTGRDWKFYDPLHVQWGQVKWGKGNIPHLPDDPNWTGPPGSEQVGGPASGKYQPAPPGKFTPEASEKDQESAAKKLSEEYKHTSDQLKQEIALHGKDSEAAKIAYEVKYGQLQGIGKGRAANLLALAREKDAQSLVDEATKNNKQAYEEARQTLHGLNETHDELTMKLALGTHATEAATMAWKVHHTSLQGFGKEQKSTSLALEASNVQLQRQLDIQNALSSLQDKVALGKLPEQTRRIIESVGGLTPWGAMLPSQRLQAGADYRTSVHQDMAEQAAKSLRESRFNLSIYGNRQEEMAVQMGGGLEGWQTHTAQEKAGFRSQAGKAITTEELVNFNKALWAMRREASYAGDEMKKAAISAAGGVEAWGRLSEAEQKAGIATANFVKNQDLVAQVQKTLRETFFNLSIAGDKTTQGAVGLAGGFEDWQRLDDNAQATLRNVFATKEASDATTHYSEVLKLWREETSLGNDALVTSVVNTMGGVEAWNQLSKAQQDAAISTRGVMEAQQELSTMSRSWQDRARESIHPFKTAQDEANTQIADLLQKKHISNPNDPSVSQTVWDIQGNAQQIDQNKAQSETSRLLEEIASKSDRAKEKLKTMYDPGTEAVQSWMDSHKEFLDYLKTVMPGQYQQDLADFSNGIRNLTDLQNQVNAQNRYDELVTPGVQSAMKAGATSKFGQFSSKFYQGQYNQSTGQVSGVLPAGTTLVDLKKIFDWEKNQENATRYFQVLSGLAQDSAQVMEKSFGELFTHGFKGFFDSVITGFEQMLEEMAVKWATSQMLQLLGGAIGGKAGLIFSQMGIQVGGPLAGARAEGGPVSAGKMYLVGERGREFFVPSTNGTIIPHGGGGPIVHNHYHNWNISTPDVQGFRKSRSQLEVEASQSINRTIRRNGA